MRRLVELYFKLKEKHVQTEEWRKLGPEIMGRVSFVGEVKAEDKEEVMLKHHHVMVIKSGMETSKDHMVLTVITIRCLDI